MKISEKIRMGRADLEREGAITIVAFGDSVTHGALAAGEINYETAYWNLLRKRILAKKNYVPVNVINSGIGGVSAKGSLPRFESQALKYEPDLLIICFGLNDINGELEDYLSALREMFRRSTERGIETVFLTPNMLNTYVAADTHPQHLAYAAKRADVQNSGKMSMKNYRNSTLFRKAQRFPTKQHKFSALYVTAKATSPAVCHFGIPPLSINTYIIPQIAAFVNYSSNILCNS